jgi:dTDP-4-amino-4,6-dideoxy-D-galactose acyltransferase
MAGRADERPRLAMAVALCEELPWDSNFFGLSIARAVPSRLDAPTLDAMLDWCRSHGTDCLYFLGAPDDTETIAHLEAGGFELVGVRVTLARPAESGRGDVRGVVRQAAAGDIPALRDIASSAHRDTRFHADSRFDAARSDEMYATWIENSVRGYADQVLVAERNGAPIGYVTLHAEAPNAAAGSAGRTARIGLFAVHAQYRNQGIGRDLLRRAAETLASAGITRTSVVTAGRNVAALRLYKSEGFKTIDVALWYHRWFRDGRR